MKTLLLTTVVALSLSAGGAFAQPSQAQGGGQTSPTGNTPNSTKMGAGAGMNNTDATKGTPERSTTTGASSGTATTGMADPAKPTAANPSSQGNAGPGTVPGK